jgi:MFS family permease
MMTGYTAIRFLISAVKVTVGPRLILLSLAGNVAGYVLLISVNGPALQYGTCLLWGVSFGCYWPCTAALLFSKLPGGRGFLAALFNLGSTTGAVVFVMLTGWLADTYSLRSALVVSPISAAAFAALYAFFSLTERGRNCHQ